MEAKRVSGKGSAWYKAGIHVLHLRGTFNEMAAQHGALLKDEIHQGAMPFLGHKNAMLVEYSHLFRDHPRLQKLAIAAMRKFLQAPMLANIPRHYLEEARALARAADFPYGLVEQSLVQADTFALLVRYFVGKHVLGEMAGGFPGCTSLVALGETTRSRGVMHARNMDYPVVGRWERFPTVFYCDPEGPDRGQRYIGITSAGLHTGGVTATNESGITLSAHWHCGKPVSPFGTPVQIIGSEISRKARTLAQAIDIASDFERAGTWSFVISSARENHAAVLEMIHGKVSVREPEDGLLVHTNHFHNPEFKEREVLLSASVINDFAHRCIRGMELLRQSRGVIDRLTLARILGDHYDRETRRVRAHGNTISVVTTVKSLIAEPSECRFWVSTRHESPTCLGDYAGFRVDEGFENFDSREPEIFRWEGDPAFTIRGTDKEETFRYFRAAYIAFHIEHDLAAAAEGCERAARMDPEEGHFHLAHGHFRMRINQPERALEAFRRADSCVMGAHMAQVAKLFLGHALDCLGRREEALAAYRQIATAAITPQLGKEARRCIRRPYRIDRASRITFDMQFCDSFEYA